ncbi:pantetheine-phosphate adenylyltransferase [Demequina gelatinilytica]|uniref:pantetheine-phosphate adenylyltransferase n=1 Tax=Demequina gelatinilytica TaxID=1638980 RepID=UPI0007841685|nr:pantetheine-phosphate adenylyltransferase [Demequina gelatinilytica]
MTTAVFPGTFDPVTWGHVDIATRARSMFSRVVIAVAHNSTKTPLLDLDTRVELARRAVQPIDGVEVTPVDGLLVDFCKEIGAGVIVKGLRGGADYDYERPMALMNRSLTGIETVFITGDNALSHVASSLVRDVARHGGAIGRYVPEGVVDAVAEALSRQ